MITRWLLPGKKLDPASFFATNFQFYEIGKNYFLLCEMTISLETLPKGRRSAPNGVLWRREIRLGLISVYHANRILEIKGAVGG